MFGGRLGIPELIIFAIIVVVILKTGRIGRYALGGFILGALAGFLIRPAVPVIGQLSFGVVITRGANLTGVDSVLRSTAEQSFNYMLFGAIIGAVVLGVVASRRPRQHEKENAPAKTKPVTAAVAVQPTSGTRFCAKCGEVLAADSAFCGSCGARLA